MTIQDTIVEILTTPAKPQRACWAHPEHERDGCPPCAEADAARIAREIEQMKLEAQTEGLRRLERIPARYRDARANHPEVLAWAKQFGEDAETPLPGLLVLGATGVGKTWQAYGALKRIALTPVKARFGYRARNWKATTFADMCASLRPRLKVDTEEVMKSYRDTELLLIDDLAAAKGSDWVEEVTYRLINGRYEDMRPTIFTTNLTVPQLREAIGDRIASRLAENCTRVAMAGDDRRRQPKEA